MFQYYYPEPNPAPGSDWLDTTYFSNSKKDKVEIIYSHEKGKINAAIGVAGNYFILEFENQDNPLTVLEKELIEAGSKYDPAKFHEKLNEIIPEFKTKNGKTAYAEFIQYRERGIKNNSQTGSVRPMEDFELMKKWYAKKLKQLIKEMNTDEEDDKKYIELQWIAENLEWTEKFNPGNLDSGTKRETNRWLVNTKFDKWLRKRKNELLGSEETPMGDIQIFHKDRQLSIADFKEMIQNMAEGALPSSSENNEEDEWLTKQQVAKLLQTSTTTIYRWTRNGIIIPEYFGNTPRYRKSDIMKIQEKSGNGGRRRY